MNTTRFHKAAVLGASGPAGYAFAGELVRRGIQARVISRDLATLQDYFRGLPVECVSADLVRVNSFSFPTSPGRSSNSA